jgi:uncharacterized protein
MATRTSQKHTVKRIGDIVIPILKSYGAKRAAIFGSAARGTMKKDSDIDILVELPLSIGLLDFIGIKFELEDALKRKIDLIEYAGIKKAIKKNILESQIQVI